MAKYESTLLDERTSRPYRRVMGATTLIGDDVVNLAGEDLGKIDEIMIDTPTGRIAYAVLSFGGFLGMGDKLFAIPWSRLSLDEQRKVFVLNVNRATLKKAPGFDKNDWPDMTDRNWGAQIYTYYDARPYWE